MLAVLVLAILILNGRKESRVYRAWFSPPDLRLFLEKSGRENAPLKTEGRLLDIRESGGAYVLTVQTGRKREGRIRVRLRDPEFPKGLQIGGKVLVEGTAYLAPKAANPGEFDLRGYYDSIGNYLLVRDAEAVMKKAPVLPFSDGAFRTRLFLEKGIDAGLSGDDASFLKSFLLGIRDEEFSSLSPEFSDVMMLRVLLQSGFHLTLFSSLLAKVLRRQMHRPGFRAVLILIPGFFYVAMSGFSISFVRAFMVLCIRVLAPLFKRKFDLLSAAAFSLILLLLNCPGLLFTQSVQYYLAAILAFGVLSPIILEYFRKTGALTAAVLRLMIFQAAITPLQIMNQYSSSLYQPFLSAVSLMLLSLTLSTGFTGAALLGAFVRLGEGALSRALGKAGTGFFGTAHYVLRFYRFLTKLLSGLPGAKISNGYPGPFRLILTFAALFLLTAVFLFLLRKRRRTPEEKERIPGKRMQRLFLVFLALLFAGELFLLRRPKLAENEFRIVMLDIGQGDCFLVSSGKDHFLIDCGSTSREDAGERVLLPALRYYGVSKLRAVYLTHGDEDHINGIPALLSDSAVITERLVLPESKAPKEEFASVLASETPDLKVYSASAGSSFTADSVTIRSLAPEKGSNLSGNESSLVLLFESSGFRALFTGDIPAESEEKLPRVGKIDFLKAAHHGSDYSNSASFLEKLCPETVFISCGRNNPYGHPGKEAMKRLRDTGASVFVTAECGAVCLHAKNGKTIGIRRFLLDKKTFLW